jgi:sigma-B regulation protein RsbU (phosphoserine phosphatase)
MSGNQPVVLVIDDDADFCALMATVIQSEDCQAVVATDGLSGLRLVREFSPDLVLCDYSMPDIDGAEVFRILQSDSEMEDVPRVLMSGHGCPDLRLIPADAFIAKPINTQSLRRLIRAFTRSRAASMAN